MNCTINHSLPALGTALVLLSAACESTQPPQPSVLDGGAWRPPAIVMLEPDAYAASQPSGAPDPSADLPALSSSARATAPSSQAPVPARTAPVASAAPAAGKDAGAVLASNIAAQAPERDAAPPRPAAPRITPHAIAGRERCKACHHVGSNVGARGGVDMPASHGSYVDAICTSCHRSLVPAARDGG